ncbi:mesenchyme-specific cell surface glycoprotein-like [Amphiura filiformis]|uniref:mesenchyme-specific cell surface glycoprotein-like n=1 Tax=Amphiura filiformis TaxID=82378 RepID=UPI003B2134BB
MATLRIFLISLLLALLTQDSYSAVILKPVSSINIPFAYDVGGAGAYGIEKDAVEQSAYDEETGLVYIAGDAFIHIVDYSNISNPILLDAIPSDPINDVELCGRHVAFALTGSPRDQPGEVHVYNLYDKSSEELVLAFQPITVGFEPDMLHFTKDCNTIVVANEASPFANASDIIDPEGSVSIIRFQQSSKPVVTNLNFTAFNDRADEYETKGIRRGYKGEISSMPSTFSQSLEPEYVTFNEDESKAYIALQENNAIAEVNVLTDTIDELYPLGVKSWKDLVLDPSDKDSGINLQSYDIVSLYQPDSIKFFEFNGRGYIATGNEGETVELEVGSQSWTDAKRGGKLVKDGQITPNMDADLQAALSDNTRLGRLEFSVIDGLSSSDPTKIDRLHTFGGRGMSILRADDMSLLWDSKDMIEKLHSELYPSTFNGNSKPDDPNTETPEDLMDKRSDNHGPECEAITIGELEGNTRLLFLGMGRSSSIAIFRIEATFEGGHEPVLEFESLYRGGGTDQTFSVLLENENIGNLDPEDLRFIPAAKSPTANPLLLVTGTTSGNLVMYEVIDTDMSPQSGDSRGDFGSRISSSILLTFFVLVGQMILSR